MKTVGFVLALAAGGLVGASNACVSDPSAPLGADGGSDGCLSTSCSAQAKNCGTLSDGCGAMLQCGTCTAPQVCGTTNVCGSPDGPQVTNVAVDGSAGKQARQGNGLTTIHLGGAKLDGATSVVLGTAPNQLVATISSDTASALTVIVNVPHGAALGPQALTVVTPLGSQSVPGALTITEITAAPSGSDSPDGGVGATGATESPFRTLTKAESVAGGGDTILLKNGTYSAASGESFGVLTNNNFGAYGGATTLPAGVTVKGESTAATLLVGPSKALGSGVAFIAAAGTKIETLTISQFDTAILATTGSVAVSGVHVHDNGTDGIYVRGTATATLDAVVSDANSSGGVSLWDTASLSITGGRITGNVYYGLVGFGSGSVSITGTELDANGSPGATTLQKGGINLSGILAATSTVTVTGANIHDNDELGLRIGAAVAGATVTVANTTFARNPTFGLGVAGAINLKVRGSTFTDNTFPVSGSTCLGEGFYTSDGPLVLDLGNAGGTANTFTVTATGTCRAIGDHRSANGGVAVPVTITGDTFNGVLPAAGCTTTSLDPRWYIANPGTCPTTGNVIVN